MPLPFFDPNDPLGLKKLGAGGTTTAVRPPAFNGSAGMVSPAPPAGYAASGPAVDIYAAARAASGANMGVLQMADPNNPLRMAANNAAWATQDAGRATIPLQGGVLAARGEQNAATRGYINLQGTINTARAADATRLTGAENNVSDKTAVANAQQAQLGEDARYSMLHTAKPVSVDTPYNDTTQFGPGVRRSLRPLESYVGTEVQQAERMRDSQLAASQNQVQQAGANVSDASLALSGGELAASSARMDESGANLQLQQATAGKQYLSSLARYNYEQSQVPPEPGLSLYKSPVTGTSGWYSPVDASKHEALDKAALGEPSNLVQLLANGFITPEDAQNTLTALGVPSTQIDMIMQEVQRTTYLKTRLTPLQKQQQIADQAATRPLGRHDESDLTTVLLNGLHDNNWAQALSQVLGELQQRDPSSADIKLQQLTTAAIKAAEATGGGPKIDAPPGQGFGN